MSRFCFCNCPAGFSAEPERHAPDCPGRAGAGKARTPVPTTLTDSQSTDSGVDFGIDGRSVRVSQEAYSIFLAREAAGRGKIAVLQQRLTAADELVDSAIAFVTRMIERAGGQPSIATGYLNDILDTLKPAEGGVDEPDCLLCLDKKTVPSNLAEGYVMDCPDCCGEEG